MKNQKINKDFSLLNVLDYLNKALGDVRPNHKYLRRDGSPGNYVYVYDLGDGKTAKYREPIHEEKKEDNTPIPLDANNPRDAAPSIKEELKDNGQYAFARDSAIKNKGEDLLGSARHKRNQWRGLEDAEKEGNAEELVNKKNLLNFESIDLITPTNGKNFLHTFTFSQYLNKFPDSLSYPKWFKGKSNDQNIGMILDGSAKIHLDPNIDKRELLDFQKPITVGEYKKITRKQYVDAYHAIKSRIETILNSDQFKAIDKVADIMDLNNVIVKNINPLISLQIQEIRKTDYYSPLANDLVSYGRSFTLHRDSRNSLGGKIKNILKLSQGKSNEEIVESVKKTIEGKSIPAAFGASESREKGFKPADMYVKHAEREGPNNHLSSTKEQLDFLMDKVKMRGIQWGNAVTDDERKHHTEFIANSFKDLTDALGLPEEMGSFNGRLGLAVGARGKGTALAHYEPTTRVINLTRIGGVGSLAHEWGHFFDNVANEITGKSKSGMVTESYVHKDESEFRQAISECSNKINTLLRPKMANSEVWKTLTPAKRQYWRSSVECWARAFEEYVQIKLEKMGRKNTYLAGINDTSGLWPDRKMMEEISPLFDKVFEVFKKSEYLKKAFLDVLEKKLGDVKPDHQYKQRLGSPGHYRYIYPKINGEDTGKPVKVDEKTQIGYLEEKIKQEKEEERIEDEKRSKEFIKKFNTEPVTIILSHNKQYTKEHIASFTRNAMKNLVGKKSDPAKWGNPEDLGFQQGIQSHYSMGSSHMSNMKMGSLSDLIGEEKWTTKNFPVLHAFENDIGNKAIDNYVEIISTNSGVSSWYDADLNSTVMEISNRTTFRTDSENRARFLAAYMGKRYMQSHVYLAKYGSNGQGYEYALKFDDVKELEKLIQDKSLPFKNSSIDLRAKTVYFGDVDGSDLKNFANMQAQLKRKGVKYEGKIRKATIEILEEKDFDEIISRVGESFERSVRDKRGTGNILYADAFGFAQDACKSSIQGLIMAYLRHKMT